VKIIGTRAPHSVVDELTQDAPRTRTLEVCLHKSVREPFRGLSSAPPNGLRSLSRLSVETHSVPQIRGGGAKTIQALERIKQNQNALDGTDLKLLQTLCSFSMMCGLWVYPHWNF